MCGTFGRPKTPRVLAALISILSLTACTATKTVSQTGSCASRVATTYSGPAERSYCTTVSSYPGAAGVPVTGHAYYVARTGTDNGLNGTSGDRPIRFAEIEVLNSNGDRVQCGETNGLGEINLRVPAGTEDLTIRVNSRANNESEIRASVLNCPEENGVYSISETFTPTGTPNVTLRAQYTGEVISGAFNIFDQIYNANEFLRNRIGNCGGLPASQCTPVTTSAPKVKAYWVKGFNPNSYFGDPDSAVSFYIPGTSRLFILGGIRGDTDNQDTDHFDNSVVLHEYGHFLEDIFSNTDSPGGRHTGNKVIDPRLAWSEGWGDFIQAAITDEPYYYDTVGNSSGSTSSTFAIPLEGGTAAYTNYCGVGANPSISGCDKPQVAGEGNFREFSVARMLWDIADGTGGNTNTNGDTVHNQIISVWKAITSATGFLDPEEEFRAIGYIHDYETTELGDLWDTLRTSHKHGLTEDYAQYVEADGSCGTGYVYSMSPVTLGSDNGDFSTSPLAINNDFFFYKHPGGTLNIKLTYQTRDTGVAGYNTGSQAIAANNEIESDLDLFVYDSSARYGNASDMKIISQNYYDYDNNTPEEEQKSKSLPAGDYLINVKTYTGENTSGAAIGPSDPTDNNSSNDFIDAGTTLDYKLTIGGAAVCPKDKPWK